MTTNLTVYACLVIGINAALIGGVFQSFSDFVMRGLIEASAPAGIESMQAINRTVFRSVFLTAFFLLVPATLIMAYFAWTRIQGPGSYLIIAGAASYVVLVFGVTVVGNVPMNEHLATLEAGSAEAADYWFRYGRNWTRWNHLRTIGSIITASSHLLAMLQLAAAE